MNFCNGTGGFSSGGSGSSGGGGSGGADNTAAIGNMFQHYGNTADHVLMSGRESIGGVDICSSNSTGIDMASSQTSQSYGFGMENAADIFGFTANSNAYNEKPMHDDSSAFASVSQGFMASNMAGGCIEAKVKTPATTTTISTSCGEINPTKILSNYCDAAMMMAAAAVNAQHQQQQQQRLMFANSNHSNGSDARDCNLEHGRNSISLAADTAAISIVSTSSTAALPSTSLTSTTSSTLSSASSSTLSNAPSSAAAMLNLLTPTVSRHKAQLHQLQQQQQQNQLYERKSLQHQQQQHEHEQEQEAHRLSASPNLIDISEVPLIVDVK